MEQTTRLDSGITDQKLSLTPISLHGGWTRFWPASPKYRRGLPLPVPD